MDLAKVCSEALDLMPRITLKGGWDTGPLSADALLAPAFVIGAPLVDTATEVWRDFAIQTAAGQTAALKMINSNMEQQLAVGGAIESHSKQTLTLSAECVVFGSTLHNEYCQVCFCLIKQRLS